MVHHLSVALIGRATRGLLWWNLLFLFTIVVLPYSTAVLGRYPQAPPALVFYGANVACCSLALWLVWGYAVRSGLLRPIPPAAARLIQIRFAISSAGSIVGTLLALFVAPAALAVFVLLPLAHAATWVPISTPPPNKSAPSGARRKSR